jgi:hypothetical protein
MPAGRRGRRRKQGPGRRVQIRSMHRQSRSGCFSAGADLPFSEPLLPGDRNVARLSEYSGRASGGPAPVEK